MTRRRLLLIAALPIAVVMIIVVLAMLPARRGMTKENFDRIQDGMTMQAVTEILGCKPHHLPTNISIWPDSSGVHLDRDCHRWDSLNGTIWISFDENDKVNGKASRGLHEDGIIAKILRWLNLDE
jgi:hypothetical protein